MSSEFSTFFCLVFLEDERYGGRNRRHDQRDRSRSRERDHRGSYRHDSHSRRSFSPPRWESHGRSRSPGFDNYSGITDLENIRDHGKSPDRYSRVSFILAFLTSFRPFFEIEGNRAADFITNQLLLCAGQQATIFNHFET